MANRAHVKPVNLVYGVDDRPPLFITAVLAVQHVLLMSSALIFPVLVVQVVNGSPEEMQGLVSLSMIAGGVGTILQSLRKGPLGSGYLAPEGGSEPFLPAAILAVKTGGYPLLFGMTVVTGFFEALLSRGMNRLRFLFPPEVAGVVVFMVGASIIPIAVKLFFGAGGASSAGRSENLAVAFITFAVMVGTGIWGKGSLRQFCMITGIVAGYVSAYISGLFTASDFEQLNRAPLVALPYMGHTGWSFDPAVLLPFLIAGLCAVLKGIGDIATCQKINDAGWKRPDMDTISGGILAEAAKTIFGGLIGGMAHTTSSSNIGLSLATGATSRVIAYGIGGIYILLAFFPKVSALFSVMPEPVMGAVLIFCITFMLLSGIQMIVSRMIDTRKTIVIGSAVIAGVSVDMLPGLFSNVHPVLKPLLNSSLTMATVTVLLMNLILRIGVARRAKIELAPGEDNYKKIADFMEVQGGAWGARREVVGRAVSAMNEFMESVAALKLSTGKVVMEVSFDEFNLDVSIQYPGVLMEFPGARPTEEELLHEEDAFVRLSGFLMRHYADRVKSYSKNDFCHVLFHFDH
ncbi:xanthine/uracil permeases [Pelotomaculum thermopropionicum SI]|uniref:Xanthine/uracil permeases n=1 Tax=Pelotomaculum thermopropionicum (strain DSM 13744 / JCM 10971 / SI) TaxID=370438 RepID=A5CZY9_PELTS|nr:xanthine/uracil permeases [Pelotomaculum thermopropionicum SI]